MHKQLIKIKMREVEAIKSCWAFAWVKQYEPLVLKIKIISSSSTGIGKTETGMSLKQNVRDPSFQFQNQFLFQRKITELPPKYR